MAKFDLDYRMRGKSQKIWAFSYSFSVKLTEYETPEIRTWYQITHCDYRGNERLCGLQNIPNLSDE